MWNTPFFGTDLYHVVHWFLVYSILGWIVESLYMSFCNKKWTNRGFIHGPMCPIYGVGALTVYFALKPLEGNYVALYFCGTVLATTLEYITAVIMQRLFGCIWWDYNEKPFNYKGILCLESSIAWGFYTVFLFLFLQKWVMAIVGSYPISVGIYLGAGLLIYYALDFMVSLVGAIDLNVKLQHLTRILDEMEEHLHSLNIFANRKNIQEKLEKQTGIDASQLPDSSLTELAEKYKAARSKNFILSRHFIRSYQAFSVWRRKEVERDMEQEKKVDAINVVMHPKKE